MNTAPLEFDQLTFVLEDFVSLLLILRRIFEELTGVFPPDEEGLGPAV